MSQLTLLLTQLKWTLCVQPIPTVGIGKHRLFSNEQLPKLFVSHFFIRFLQSTFATHKLCIQDRFLHHWLAYNSILRLPALRRYFLRTVYSTMSTLEARTDIPVRVWCHACDAFREAKLNGVNGEYECTICRSDCVEKENQGIEEFQERSHLGVQVGMPISDENEGLARHILSQPVPTIRGLGQMQRGVYQIPLTGGRPQLIPAASLAAGHRYPSRSPYSVPNYALSDDGDMSALAGFMSMPTAAAPSNGGAQASHQSVFGLLSSLNSMRARPALFSTAFGTSDDPLGDNSEVAARQWEDFLHHILMNETSRAGAPPASKQVLETLPHHVIADASEVSSYGECCITQDPFEIGESMVPLPCGHNYKEEPIVHWLEMHNTCPVCRVEVKSPQS